jgi:hypothetical protein
VPDNNTPNPGSVEAGELGCTCPVLDNAHGRGRNGEFWIHAGCPLHTSESGKDGAADA